MDPEKTTNQKRKQKANFKFQTEEKKAQLPHVQETPCCRLPLLCFFLQPSTKVFFVILIIYFFFYFFLSRGSAELFW